MKMLTMDKLEEYGANTAEGLARCLGNESFYFRMVGMIPDMPAFEALPKAVGEGDLEAGFEAAHALKGAIANVSLTSLLEPVEEITELLRAHTQTDYSSLLDRIENKRAELKALCS